MKILFYISRFPGSGGIETITQILTKLFSQRLGHQVSIFSVFGQEGFPTSKPEWIYDYFIASQHTDCNYAYYLDQFIAKHHFDIVIYQDSYANTHIPLLEARIKYGFKLIVCEHNTPNSYILQYLQRWRSHSIFSLKGAMKKIAFPYVYLKILNHTGKRHKLLIDSSDSYILLSEHYKNLLKKYWRISDSKITAIPNIKNDFGLPEYNLSEITKKKQAIFVGRLTEAKGIRNLLEVWQRIESQNPSWTLKILGEGELSEFLIEEITRRKLKNIKIEGFRNDIERYYKESSIILMTSLYEGLPMSLIEAMQFGVIPIVFNTFEALQDIVTDLKDGIMVKPFDYDEYAKAFSLVARNKNLSEMRQNAISHSRNFSSENILRIWQNLLECVYF